MCPKITIFFFHIFVSAKSTVQEWPLSAGPASEELLIMQKCNNNYLEKQCGSQALLNICKMKIRAIHLNK